MATVKKDLRGLERQIKNLLKFPMEDIAFRALELNFDQIEKKKNKDGSKFKPYTSRYAKRKGVGVGAVDLTSKARGVSNKNKPYATMLKSFTVLKTNRWKAEVGFRGAWEKLKAHYNVSGGNSKDKARPFVGITKRNQRKLIKFAYSRIIKGTY